MILPRNRLVLGAMASAASLFVTSAAHAATSGGLVPSALFLIQITLLLLFGRLLGEAAQRLDYLV